MRKLEKNPKAMAVLQPHLQAIIEAFTGNKEEQSDAATEAVSDEMGEAMLRYMPLRGLMSFSGGAITYDRLVELSEEINSME